jgi:hypothetical protein
LKVDSFSLVLAADGLVISEGVLLDVLSKLSYDSAMLFWVWMEGVSRDGLGSAGDELSAY